MDTNVMKEVVEHQLNEFEGRITERLGATREEFQKERKKIDDSFAEHRANTEKLVEGLATKAEIAAVMERMSLQRAEAVLVSSEDQISQKQAEFGRFIGMTVRQNEKGLAEMRAKAALQEDTDAEGGYLVPDQFVAEVLRIAGTYGWASQYCRTIMMSRKTATIPRELTGVSFSWVAEEADMESGAASEPTFDTVTLTANKAAIWMRISEELEEDEAVGLGAYLATLVGEAWAKAVDYQALLGNSGGGDPFDGWATNSDVAEYDHSDAVLSWDVFPELIASIEPSALQGARFIFNQTILKKLMNLKDSADQPIWQPTVAGTPATIAGFPYTIDTQIPDVAGTPDVTEIYFGNPNKIILGRRRGMTMKRSEHVYFKTGQVALRTDARLAVEVGLPAGLARAINVQVAA